MPKNKGKKDQNKDMGRDHGMNANQSDGNKAEHAGEKRPETASGEDRSKNSSGAPWDDKNLM